MCRQSFLKIFSVTLLLAFSLGSVNLSQAQSEEAGRIIHPMTAVDGITLQAGGTSIVLWGIREVPPSGSPLQLKAVDLLDSLIGGMPVNCKVSGGTPPDVTATCTAHSNLDLGLELLNQGYAVVDRRQTADQAFAATYAKAQEVARLEKKGIWRLAAEDDRNSRIPVWLQPLLPLLVPLALIIGPLAGVLITVFMMHYWLEKMSTMQREERELSVRKEMALASRERYVLLSTLEGEMSENRNKADAFLLIYNDMLHSFKRTDEQPKYQKAGDIVQKQPSFSKMVFEANLGKLSLLDMRLAGQLSKLYASLPTGREYINLDPTMPIEDATKALEVVLWNAEKFIPELDSAIQALQAASAARLSV